jgi:2-methylcitrate dehydratase PrpD
MKPDLERTELLAAGEATRALGAYIADLHYADLPPAVVSKARECLLDALGCCLYGMTRPWTRMVLEMVLEQGGLPQATVLGTRHRTSASQAVLVNSTAGHGFELDDMHSAAHLHAGSLTVPVALALGERRASASGRVDGRSFLTAMVAGYEVGLRVGLAATGSLFMRGFHFQGTCGAFVAAASAAKMLDLDAEQARHALGIAGSQAAGLMAAQEGAMAKRLHAGRAAQSGVYAGLLANRGFTGILNVLEAPYGGFISSHTDSARPEELTRGLGSRWEILNVGYKPYASAASTHSAIYALSAIMKENKLAAVDIAEIHLQCSTMAHVHCAWEYRPQGVTSAQMSLYFTLAAMAYDGEVLIEQFEEERLADPALLDFMRRIHITVDPAYDVGGDATRHHSRMQVTARDGRVFEKTAPYRKGSLDFPMIPAERYAKFRRLAQAAVPEETVEKIIAEVETIDSAADIGPLVSLLQGVK